MEFEEVKKIFDSESKKEKLELIESFLSESESNRKSVYNLIDKIEQSREYYEDEDIKKFASLTIKDELDLKRIQWHFREKNESLYICWMIGQNTGLRGGDVCKLTIGDLRKAIKLKKMIVVEEKIEHIWQNRIKRGKSVRGLSRKDIARTVPLNNDLIKILKIFVLGKKDSDFVYPTNSKEGHIRRDSLGKAYKRELIKLNIASEDDVIGTHTPRKTYGYLQYKDHGENIDYVRKLFCHSSNKITAVYIGIDDEEVEKSAKTMDKHTY